MSDSGYAQLTSHNKFRASATNPFSALALLARNGNSCEDAAGHIYWVGFFWVETGSGGACVRACVCVRERERERETETETETEAKRQTETDRDRD